MTGDVFAAAVAAATAGGGGPRALRREGPFSEEAGLAFRWIAAFMVKVLCLLLLLLVVVAGS